ncbi:polysaccharide deacetylase family protein [Fusibacter tunisiensis]|uniref:Peptidoglycan/xylan/chitin deacetylase (PgdA/CDA1 family) n=1 Tax=Fusibacter tunisiensis TaxID=1008308 RepID=A0ABS2MNA5_9FIRM|nr:polysaccharide deacetylase family protein [Fusibacter tunisiensis]MBM7560870.1 peptidoglycan/xylan/chitin deacetylase (PgdA/CDA1 family) [Fusibacter tunisiensis]
MRGKWRLGVILSVCLCLSVGTGGIGFADVTPVSVPVLMYHHISDDVTGDAVVDVFKFFDDMWQLKKAGFETIALADLIAYVEGTGVLPEKPILVTFDDGYASNYVYAFPILKSLKMKAVINVIGWSVGLDRFVLTEDPIIPHFTWEAAREMVESGLVEIENHTYDLHSPEGLSYDGGMPVGYGMSQMAEESDADYATRILEDTGKMTALIESKTGRVPVSVAYPYGAFSEATEQVLEAFGVVCTFSTVPEIRSFGTVADLRAIPRLNVTGEVPVLKLLESVDGFED